MNTFAKDHPFVASLFGLGDSESRQEGMNEFQDEHPLAADIIGVGNEEGAIIPGMGADLLSLLTG